MTVAAGAKIGPFPLEGGRLEPALILPRKDEGMGVNLTSSHADNHDLDKLARWNGDLSSWEDMAFPVYALFLVSPEDRTAHDVFRKYRDSFESRGAGFGNLVIFGQHGISTTVRGILEGLGLDLGNLPLLALFAKPTSRTVHTLSLPAGTQPTGSPEPSSKQPARSKPDLWRDVLKRLEDAVDGQPEHPDLKFLNHDASLRTGRKPVLELVSRVLTEIS